MNKIRLFKIYCIVASTLFISTTFAVQNSYASVVRLNNAISVEQSMKEVAVTVNVKNKPLKNILYEIQKQSGISFAFNEAEFGDRFSTMSLQVKNTTVEAALSQLLASTDLTYKVVGNSVAIVQRSPQTTQQVKKFTLSGKVIDGSTKRGIPGATVLVVGTTSGAITDDKGDYSLSISVGQSIEVSFMGMKPFLKKIDTEVKTLNITMEVDQMNIDNVVVTGYGNINKNSFTGNATTVKGEDLMKVSRTNVIKALQSFDPSFRLGDNIQFGNDPNAVPDVYIRGRSSLGTMGLDKDNLTKDNLEKNPNTPTFIIDGFEVSLQKVYDLDPNRIQTLTILKDAAATAMYGSRAANGVIVITTVPPKEGELRVTYNLTTTLELPDLSDYNLMNSREKLEAERLSGVFDNSIDYTGPYNNYLRKYNAVFVEGVETDWMALPLRNAFKHKHSAAVEGGTKNIRYLFDANYEGDSGVMKESARNSGAVGISLNMVFNKFSINNKAEFNNISEIESPYGSFSDYVHMQPYSKYMDEKGAFSKQIDLTSTPNPMYEASLNNFSRRKTNEFSNNLRLRYDFLEGLFAEGQFSINHRWTDNNRFVDPLSRRSSVLLDTDNMFAGDLFSTLGNSGRLNGRFLLSYNKTVNKHNINLSATAEINQDKGNTLSTHYRGFPSGLLSSINYATEVNGKPSSIESKSRTAGVSGVFNYSYDNIYLADVSLRYEGSSAFGTESKAAPYWASGIGINVHNYKFMEAFKAIDVLRIRASYGQTGNVNFPAYAAQSFYKTMFDDWYITGYGTKIEYLGNTSLKPEKSNTFDVGLNLTLLGGRLDIKASYYNETTVDMINDVTIPTSSGFKTYKDNLGKVRNVGYEAIINYNVIRKKDFNLMLNFNFAQNRNSMLEIDQSLKNYNERVNDYYGSDTGAGRNDNDKNKIWTKYEEGRSMTALYGMKSLGIDPSTGQEIYINRAGGVVYEWDAREMTDIGDTEPKGQGNFGLNARYKNLTLSATFQYEFGGYYYNETLSTNVENAKIEQNNVDKRVLTERWQKPGDITALRDIKDKSGETKPTSRFMQKNNVLSFNAISLQYEFSDEIAKALRIERLRLEASSSDLFRASTIKQERGLSYPFARSFALTLMINF